MKRFKKVIFAILICVMTALSFSACTTQLSTSADIELTIMPSNAEVDVVAADGTSFNVSGNVYSIKNAEIKNYQISITSKEGAAISFAPQVINILAADLNDGEYKKTVTMEEFKEYFIAEITVQGANSETIVEGLGVQWTKTGTRYRAKAEKDALTLNNRTITVSSTGYASRTIALDDTLINDGYYFASIRLGMADKAYKTYVVNSKNSGINNIEVISLLSGKNYTYSKSEQWHMNSINSTLFLELDKNDIVQVKFNYFDGLYAEKFATSETYLDDVNLTANKANLKAYRCDRELQFEYLFYYEGDKKIRTHVYNAYDEQTHNEYFYFEAPIDAEIYKIEQLYNDVAFEYYYYQSVSKNAASLSKVTLNSFKYYNEQGDEVNITQAQPISVTVKVKNALTNNYIAFKVNERDTPSLEKQMTDDGSLLVGENHLSELYFYSSNDNNNLYGFMMWFFNAVDGVYEINVLEKNILDAKININTVDSGGVQLVSGYYDTETSGTQAVYSLEKITEDYFAINVYVNDDFSRILNSYRMQVILIWRDELEQNGEYNQQLWFNKMYRVEGVLYLDNNLLMQAISQGYNYFYTVNSANEGFSKENFELGLHYYMDANGNMDYDNMYYKVYFEFLENFEADITITLTTYNQSGSTERIYSLVLSDETVDVLDVSENGYIKLNLTFVKENIRENGKW